MSVSRAPEWRMHITFPSHSATEIYWGRPLTFLQKLSREVMTTPAMIFQELYIKILLKLFKEVLLSTTVDPLLMSWWKPTQEQPLNLPKTMFAMVMLQII